MPSQVGYNQPILTQFPATPAIPARRTNTWRFDQVVRIGFQVAGTPFSTQAALMLATNWTTLLAATDQTRIILSPPFSGTKIMTSKAMQTAPDSNATYRGLPVYFGEGTSEFSADFLDVDPAVLDDFMQVVAGFSQGLNGENTDSLVGYWVNKDGMIFSTPTWGGLPCVSLQMRTRGSDGLNSSDKNGFSFYLPPNWDGGNTLPTVSSPVGTSGGVDLRTIAW